VERLRENCPIKYSLTEYLEFLQFERGLSPLTRENYTRDITKLIELAEKLVRLLR
jgi:site-specific recombinase XerC